LKKMRFISFVKKTLEKYREKKDIDSLKEFEIFYLKSFLLSVNFEDYLNKRIDPRRRKISIFICIFQTIISLKFLLAGLISNRKLSVFIGDPTQITGDPLLVNLVLFSIGLGLIIGRIIYIIGERFQYIKLNDCLSLFYLFKNLYLNQKI